MRKHQKTHLKQKVTQQKNLHKKDEAKIENNVSSYAISSKDFYFRNFPSIKEDCISILMFQFKRSF